MRCRIPDPILLPGLRGAPHTSLAVCGRRRWQRRSPCCGRREPPPPGVETRQPQRHTRSRQAYSPTQRSPPNRADRMLSLRTPARRHRRGTGEYGCGSTNLATALACSPDAERRTTESIKLRGHRHTVGQRTDHAGGNGTVRRVAAASEVLPSSLVRFRPNNSTDTLPSSRPASTMSYAGR